MREWRTGPILDLEEAPTCTACTREPDRYRGRIATRTARTTADNGMVLTLFLCDRHEPEDWAAWI